MRATRRRRRRRNLPARLLVIKLGALGDFVQALGPCAAIRAHHKSAHITLLTTAPFADLARESGYFDEVHVDFRPSWRDIGGWLALRRFLRGGGFTRVYDLQTSDRTSFYFWIMLPGQRPEWSGVARFCSHPDSNPERTRIHTVERQREQLRLAGILETTLPRLAWVETNVERFGLARPYVLLAAGGAAHRPAKRWPVASYGKFAAALVRKGILPVLIGGAEEAPLTLDIRRHCAGARDLCGQTSLADIVALARRAAGAVGNDTGPMHLIAGADCPCLVLFSRASDPARCAPRAATAKVAILRRPNLATLAVAEVEAALVLR